MVRFKQIKNKRGIFMKDSVVKEEKISTSEEIKDEKKNKDKK